MKLLGFFIAVFSWKNKENCVLVTHNLHTRTKKREKMIKFSKKTGIFSIKNH